MVFEQSGVELREHMFVLQKNLIFSFKKEHPFIQVSAHMYMTKSSKVLIQYNHLRYFWRFSYVFYCIILYCFFEYCSVLHWDEHSTQYNISVGRYSIIPPFKFYLFQKLSLHHKCTTYILQLNLGDFFFFPFFLTFSNTSLDIGTKKKRNTCLHWLFLRND